MIFASLLTLKSFQFSLRWTILKTCEVTFSLFSSLKFSTYVCFFLFSSHVPGTVTQYIFSEFLIKHSIQEMNFQYNTKYVLTFSRYIQCQVHQVLLFGVLYLTYIFNNVFKKYHKQKNYCLFMNQS